MNGSDWTPSPSSIKNAWILAKGLEYFAGYVYNKDSHKALANFTTILRDAWIFSSAEIAAQEVKMGGDALQGYEPRETTIRYTDEVPSIFDL